MKRKYKGKRKLALKKAYRKKISFNIQNRYYLAHTILALAKEGNTAAIIKVIEHYEPIIENYTRMLTITDKSEVYCKSDEKLKMAMKIGLVMAIIES